MGIRIKTNVESLAAQRQLTQSRREMNDSFQKLASGYRINKSSDDAAGLAVSETMRAKIKSLAVTKRNANDAISYLQVAEGGLSELNNMMIRMRELTTQAASDTIGATERTFLNREFTEIAKEVNRVKEDTEFNGRKVLSSDGLAAEGMSIQVGASFRGNGREVPEGVDTINIQLDQVSEINEALEALKDLTIEGENGRELGGGNTDDIFAALDTTMNKVTDFRATVGSIQSRLGSAITAMEVGMENMEAAQSQVRDVDYAAETARLTQNRILSAAGTAVLSQANSNPEVVLQLLR